MEMYEQTPSAKWCEVSAVTRLAFPGLSRPSGRAFRPFRVPRDRRGLRSRPACALFSQTSRVRVPGRVARRCSRSARATRTRSSPRTRSASEGGTGRPAGRSSNRREGNRGEILVETGGGCRVETGAVNWHWVSSIGLSV